MKDDVKSLNYRDFFINYEGIFRVEQIDMIDDLDSFIIYTDPGVDNVDLNSKITSDLFKVHKTACTFLWAADENDQPFIENQRNRKVIYERKNNK